MLIYLTPYFTHLSLDTRFFSFAVFCELSLSFCSYNENVKYVWLEKSTLESSHKSFMFCIALTLILWENSLFLLVHSLFCTNYLYSVDVIYNYKSLLLVRLSYSTALIMFSICADHRSPAFVRKILYDLVLKKKRKFYNRLRVNIIKLYIIDHNHILYKYDF